MHMQNVAWIAFRAISEFYCYVESEIDFSFSFHAQESDKFKVSYGLRYTHKGNVDIMK